VAAGLLVEVGVVDALRLVVHPRDRRSSRPVTSWAEAWPVVQPLAPLVVGRLVLLLVLLKARASVHLEAWPLLTRRSAAQLLAPL